jgi:hypothetical protein
VLFFSAVFNTEVPLLPPLLVPCLLGCLLSTVSRSVHA